MEAAARRIEEIDGAINALPLRFVERAREAAKRLESAPAERPARRGWLAGLPISVLVLEGAMPLGSTPLP